MPGPSFFNELLPARKISSTLSSAAIDVRIGYCEIDCNSREKLCLEGDGAVQLMAEEATEGHIVKNEESRDV